VQRSPLKLYQELVSDDVFIPDDDQLRAVRALDGLWHDLRKQHNRRLLNRLRRGHDQATRGLYLWGSVGRGKTWLMDLFFEHLPEPRKQRIHFHRFMQRVHQGLREFGQEQNPLPLVANKWAKNCRVLCLDEFFVADIADAMLLGGLLEALFQKGVTLVTTSNIEPEGLYHDGLQRAKFLPAIELIKENMQVLELGGSRDFRLRILEQSKIFHFPLGEKAKRAMSKSFDRMAADCQMNHELEINGRSFHANRRGDGIIWFEFEELCSKPRGSIDYIEIARAFNTVFISDLPQLDDRQANETRRFITMVDEFYDRNVKLLISAAVPLPELYTGKRLAFEFERTTSRLTEMQSHDYLAKPHLP
jgi:cell division protein ZapE